jgi:hypothetical protein
MHGKDLLVDDGCDGQAVEAIGKGFPQLDVVSSFALVVEAVDAVDGRALVVAAQYEEILGVLDLVCEQQADCLQRLFASVYIVAKEEVICFRWKAAIFEETQKIIILTVNVTADLVEGQQKIK